MKENRPEKSARVSGWLWLLLAAGAGATGVLFLFNPSSHAFYPRCLLYSVTGLSCPGCGSLRAMHTLLHGDVAGAFRLNPLLIVLLPFLAMWFAGTVLRITTLRPWFAWIQRPLWLWLLLAVIVMFGIARNLPFGPLAQFAL